MHDAFHCFCLVLFIFFFLRIGYRFTSKFLREGEQYMEWENRLLNGEKTLLDYWSIFANCHEVTNSKELKSIV